MKKKSPQAMTLDSLATLIQGEFLVIREQFAEVHAEIASVRTELKEEIRELRQIVNRIDIRTQNQVDLIYEENTVMKKDMKTMKQDIISTTTLSQKNKKDITSIKAHVGMKR